jgi:hypothetical protein
MLVAKKILQTILPSTLSQVYQLSSSTKLIVRELTFCNLTDSPKSVDLVILPNGESITDAYYYLKNFTLQAYETVGINNELVLSPADSIQALASSADSVSLTVSGIQEGELTTVITGDVTWTSITDGPSSTPLEIDSAVSDTHTHSNSATLNATEESFTTVLKDQYDAAEENQTAFGTIAGISATFKTDSISLIEGDNISITADSGTKQITIGVNNFGLDADTLDGYEAADFPILDATDKIPLSYLPDLSANTTYVVFDSTARLAIDTGTLAQGDKAYETDTGDSYIWDGSAWLVLADADWENVSLEWANISNKPISSVTAIDGAVGDSHTHSNSATLDLITSDVKTNYDTAYTHSQAAHAPSSAEANQNAFSTIGGITAGSATDTLTLIAGSNVTITPSGSDITIAASTGTTYTDSDAIAAINGDTDHGSTANHNYFSGDYTALSNKPSIAYSSTIAADAFTSTEVTNLKAAKLDDGTTPWTAKQDALNADQIRKITISTSGPSGGTDGDLWIEV